jgi:anion-transporting  ArsA/GET3 family ATPase
LRTESTQFVVVTAPYPATVREAIHFRAQLVERGFPFGGFVCNRVHLPVPSVDAATLEAPLRGAGVSTAVASALAADLAGLVADHDRMAERDAESLDRLREVAGDALDVVPLLPEDVHDLQGLATVGRWLVGA